MFNSYAPEPESIIALYHPSEPFLVSENAAELCADHHEAATLPNEVYAGSSVDFAKEVKSHYLDLSGKGYASRYVPVDVHESKRSSAYESRAEERVAVGCGTSKYWLRFSVAHGQLSVIDPLVLGSRNVSVAEVATAATRIMAEVLTFDEK